MRARHIPTGGGGERTSDGRLWFTTSRGLAVLRSRTRASALRCAPMVHMVEMTADGEPVDLSRSRAAWRPAAARMQIRYTAIHLSAPERVRYSYRLDGAGPGLGTRGQRAA